MNVRDVAESIFFLCLRQTERNKIVEDCMKKKVTNKLTREHVESYNKRYFPYHTRVPVQRPNFVNEFYFVINMISFIHIFSSCIHYNLDFSHLLNRLLFRLRIPVQSNIFSTEQFFFINVLFKSITCRC